MCRPTSAAPRIALSETTKNLSSQSVLTVSFMYFLIRFSCQGEVFLVNLE